MGEPRIRPTFEIATELTRRAITERIRAKLAVAKESISASVILSETIELVPHSSVGHFWSPQLRLDLAEADGRTTIHARFSPHPHVWTLYLAVHAIGALGTLGAAMFGISQYLAGQPAWALWALPIAPVLAALVWAFAFVGQGLAAEQMYGLRRFVEEALDDSPAL